MFGSTEHDKILAALFFDRFGDQSGAELHRFLENLKQVELSFDLVAQMRTRDYPGFHGFECGLPPSYYYFVPGSSYGGHQPFPEDPLDPGFVAVTDGLGLNFGCPLKLKRAIETLIGLAEDDQKDCRVGLAVPTKHLATVEELLSASIWKHTTTINRPKGGKKKSHDWRIIFPNVDLNVECKFIPASWAKIVDGVAFDLMDGTLAKKASAQLPNPPIPGSINVAAIAGIASVDDGFRRLCRKELGEFPNVQVIVYRDAVGQVTVFSLSASVARQIHGLIEPWSADEFRGLATVVSNRPEKARRAALRRTRGVCAVTSAPADLSEILVECLPPRKIHTLPPDDYPYRFDLETRLGTGEPVFRWIPPFLPAP